MVPGLALLSASTGSLRCGLGLTLSSATFCTTRLFRMLLAASNGKVQLNLAKSTIWIHLNTKSRERKFPRLGSPFAQEQLKYPGFLPYFLFWRWCPQSQAHLKGKHGVFNQYNTCIFQRESCFLTGPRHFPSMLVRREISVRGLGGWVAALHAYQNHWGALWNYWGLQLTPGDADLTRLDGSSVQAALRPLP